MGTIENAKNTALNIRTGTIPNMGVAMLDWFQLVTFTRILKTVEAFQLVETLTDINFWGIVEPLSGDKLAMKPEGQQNWNWLSVTAQPQLKLVPDEIIIFLGVKYRVMNQKDYSIYSYVRYEIVEDYVMGGSI